jgi:hypothetical protein
MNSRPALFDPGQRTPPPPRTSTALIPRPPHCPRCHQPLHRLPTVHQPALFHGLGYGATQTTIRDHCTRCGWLRTAAIASTNPHHLEET